MMAPRPALALPRGIGDIARAVHDRQVLSAKLEQYRRQMLCRSLCDDLAQLGAAGEEDEVERQFEEAGIGLAAAATTATACSSK
jgi:hypothetical protein